MLNREITRSSVAGPGKYRSSTAMAVCAFAVILMLFALCEGQYDYSSYSKHSYPNPRKDPVMCGRIHVAKSYVCDPDHILGPQDTEANQLDGMIAKIINETACPCSAYSCEHHREGYKIGIALIRKMVPKSDAKSQDDDLDEGEARKRKILKGLHEAQDYALEIQKRWMLGRCDEDVIIFYSIEDNVVYTITGDVARTKLTNEIVASVAREARRTGFVKSPFDGLYKMLNDYRAVFLNSYHVRGPKKGGSTQQNGGLSLLGSRAAVVVMVAAALLGIFVM